MNNIYISLLESIYIIFMYNFFKTEKSFHHILEIIINIKKGIFYHPINTGLYENKICDFGKLSSFLISIWFLTRHFITKSNELNKIFLKIIFIISLLMNLNAFIYLIPIFITEFSQN
jgi:hypothetical protein